MKLSKLYSNMSDKFEPILFNDGLNVIVGEIRLHKNEDKDTHNLGKTVLGRLINFCLLGGVGNEFFLKKHKELFQDFVFFIEIKLSENKYLTISRNVIEHTKISFKFHNEKDQDYSDLTNWDHNRIAFERAKVVLDGYLDFNIIKPWSFRDSMGYALRSQIDFIDIFKLNKFKGKDIDWKPFVSKLFGFEAELVKKQYELKKEINLKNTEKNRLKAELAGLADDSDKLEGFILVKEQDIGNLQKQLDEFDFYLEDADVNKELVEELDYNISDLNEERYYKSENLKRVRESLEQHKIIFKPDEAKDIFAEAGIYFNGQVKKSFDDLILFNKEYPL